MEICLEPVIARPRTPWGAFPLLSDPGFSHALSGFLAALAPLSALLLPSLSILKSANSPGLTLLLCVAINALACFGDLRVLRTAGYDTNTLKRWTVVLAPVYLYRRAKICGPNFFWLWLVCALALPPVFAYEVKFRKDG